ncbi:DUF5908 family protein [Aquimarina sp. BL5]|uniref:DUF5908 family protein n=1 Tax=Aquimarina sp. BL5 TaxID=1714860 RepID=UPI0013142A4F|nr:DUF5908 family protein [Aquimarina sp. BL5]
MPVEIKVLIIRTTIDNQNEPEGNNSSSEDCSAPSPSESNQVQLDEVLRMIKNKNER